MVKRTGKMTVLLIEDDPDQVFLYQTKFRLEGMEVYNTPKGGEAVVMAKAKRPDIILLDVILEDMDGVEVLKKLKEDKDTATIPVILFTNLATQEVIEQGKKFGALEVLIKTDYTPARLVAKVRQKLAEL